MRSHLTTPRQLQVMMTIGFYPFRVLRPPETNASRLPTTPDGARRSCFQVKFPPSTNTVPAPAGPNVRHVTARHRFRHHFRDTPSTLRGNVGATCQRRTTTRRKARAMSTMWSSPEHRGEHCASCADERVFDQPSCLDGHRAGHRPERACAERGHALFSGVSADGDTFVPRRPAAVA